MPITPGNPFKGRHYSGEMILLAVRWYLRYPLAYERVLPVRPRHSGAHQLLIQIPSVRQDDLGHDALVAIDVAHADGHSLAERQVAAELLGPRAPGLPAL